jgi:uncharacterized coiled-coil protein SlyX
MDVEHLDHPHETEARADRRLETLERIVGIQATHHEHLARQIAELTVSMQELRRDIPELMAQGLVRAVGDPKTWEAARQAMRVQAKDAAGGAVLGALGAVWDKVKWVIVGIVCLWALRGPEVVIDALRMLWRGHGS